MGDPAAFADAAEYHLVVPVIAPILSELDLPADVRSSLMHKAHTQALRSLHAGAQLGEIVSTLTTAGVPLLVLKGLPLALNTTGRLAGRHPGDIDVLIDVGTLDEAAAALVAGGWDPPRDRANGVDPSWRRWLRYVFNQVLMTRDDAAVEIHWRLESTVATDVDFAGLWHRRGSVSPSDTEIPVLGEVDEMTFVAVHAGRHRLERLKWAVDVARLLAQRPQLVDEVTATADAWHARRCLDVAFDGVDALGLLDLGATPDPSILEPLDKFALMRFRYGLVERPADKVRMLAGYVGPQPALADERVPDRLALAAAPFRQLWRGISRR
ncbi:MAG: nucleotidyltransferase family protein [Acidimicrobiales bacterium]